MQKSTEERLVAIENGIIRLIKMEGCLFNVLLLLDKNSSLVNKCERAVSLHEVSLGSIRQGLSYTAAFMFGAIALFGVSVSLFSLYLITQDFVYRVLGIVFVIIGLATIIYAAIMNRRAGSEIRKIKEELTQTRERLAGLEKDAASLDEALAQALVEWKELVPDYSVGEFRNEAIEPHDSRGRS